MVSCRSLHCRSLTLALLAHLILPTNAEINIALDGAKQPTYKSGSTVQVSWTRTDSDPTVFNIGGQGFPTIKVDTQSQNAGSVSMKIPAIAPGNYEINAEDLTHSTKYSSFQFSVNLPPGSDSAQKEAPLATPTSPTDEKTSTTAKSSATATNTTATTDSSKNTQSPTQPQPPTTPTDGSPQQSGTTGIPQDTASSATTSAMRSAMGLSTGPLIGIVLGIFAMLSILGLIAAILYKRRQRAMYTRRHHSFNRDMMVRTTTPASGMAGGRDTKGWETFSQEESYRDDVGTKS